MPATAVRRLFANWFSKTLQISDRNGGEFILPAFAKYETVPFEVVVVEPDLEAAGLGRYRRVDISNLSLKMGLHSGLDSATPLCYQNTWSKDESQNIFSAEFALNTAALNSWLDADEKTAYFQISLEEGTASTNIYQATVTVKKSVLQVNPSVPSPVDEYYTKAQASAQFAQKVMPAGEQFTITSPSGNYVRIFGVDDGGNVIDQVLPA